MTHPEFPNIERYEPLKEHNPDGYQRIVMAAPWPWIGTIKTFGLPLGFGGDVCVGPDASEILGQFWVDKRSERYGWIDVELSWLEFI